MRVNYFTTEAHQDRCTERPCDTATRDVEYPKGFRIYPSEPTEAGAVQKQLKSFD